MRCPRATGGAFDHVDKGQLQRAELLAHVVVERLRVAVLPDVIGVTGERRMPVRAGADGRTHRPHHLDEQARAVFDLGHRQASVRSLVLSLRNCASR